MDLSQRGKGHQASQTSYDPLPEGNYNATIDGCEICKNGALRVQFAIHHAEHKGRKTSGFFNFDHPDPQKAAKIDAKYAELLQALGFIDLRANPQAQGFQDSSQIRSLQDLERQKRPVNLKVYINEYEKDGKQVRENRIGFYNRIQDQEANRQQGGQSGNWGQQPQQQQQQQSNAQAPYQGQQQQPQQQSYAQSSNDWNNQQPNDQDEDIRF